MKKLILLLLLWGCTTDNNPNLAPSTRPNERTININIDPETGKATVETGTLLDERDGKEYSTVGINGKWWMAENLAYLPKVHRQFSNDSIDPARYFVYGYNGEDVAAAKAHQNYPLYGVLYNHIAAQTACPAQWHLPSQAEWETLLSALDAPDDAGTMLKSELWDGTDAIGFNALPGENGSWFTPVAVHEKGNWWSATPSVNSPLDDMYYSVHLTTGEATVHTASSFQNYGYSVRCVKD